ncbi:MAG: Stp1/IreP family PP2C-type Ser/Thr phosphatase [Clostridia bacterium]
MRKFNLKGKVAQKLKGLETAVPENPTADAGNEASQAQPETALTEHGEIRYAWRTDVGRIRKNNQDTVILGNGLFGVADGMGGHNGGEIASAGLRDGLLRETEGQDPSLELLEEAVKKVNYEIWEQQEKDASLTGMGTTLTVLWAADKEMIIGQVGDSRAYLIRDGQMKQVTSDHSMVADMVRRGVLTEEQAACHPMRNYITRAVGTDDTLDVDLISIPRMNGDRWIICSDGLYGQISKQELEDTAKVADLEEAAGKLLELALEHGGRDNITLVLMQDEFIAGEQETAGKTEDEPMEDVTPEDADQEGVTEE